MPKALPPRKDEDDYTLQEFADTIRVSLGTVKNLIKRGKLAKSWNTEGTVVIAFSEAERFRESRLQSSVVD